MPESVPGGGVSAPGGGLSASDTHPSPVNRITDTSKNITLATTSLRPVITVAPRYFDFSCLLV